MKKVYDKKSGAVIIKHTPEELQQAADRKRLNQMELMVKRLCKALNVSEEDLAKIVLEEEEKNG